MYTRSELRAMSKPGARFTCAPSAQRALVRRTLSVAALAKRTFTVLTCALLLHALLTHLL